MIRFFKMRERHWNFGFQLGSNGRSYWLSGSCCKRRGGIQARLNVAPWKRNKPDGGSYKRGATSHQPPTTSRKKGGRAGVSCSARGERRKLLPPPYPTRPTHNSSLPHLYSTTRARFHSRFFYKPSTLKMLELKMDLIQLLTESLWRWLYRRGFVQMD